MGDSRKILITGGTGAIGTGLVSLLKAEGFALRVLTLPGDDAGKKMADEGVDVIYGDIADPESVNGLCRGIATVIHLAAVILSRDDDVFDKINVTGTRYLLTDAKNAGVCHFIHVSSASVVYRKMTPYSRSKRIAERYVKESALPWTIVRPTLAYGKSGGMEFDLFLKKLATYPIIPVIGSGKAKKRPVYIDDLVDGLFRIATAAQGQGKIYNLSGGSSISMLEFTKLCLTLLGREDRIVLPIPVPLCRIAAAVMERFMEKPLLSWNMIAGAVQDADLDPADAILDLGYAPVAFEQKIGDCFPRRY